MNEWIGKIDRRRPYRKNKAENCRFDMAERSINYSHDLFERFLKTLTQEDFITYPSHEDYDDLRSRIAKFNGVKIENIFLAAGSEACIESLIHATSNDTTSVVSSFPCFPMYFVYSDCYNTNFKKVEYGEDNIFSIDRMIQSIDDNTSLAILANPNSPFGDHKSVEELEKLCEYTSEKQIVLMIDEAYVEFSPGTSLPLISRYDNVVISRTFSKAWGAAGTRVGYMIGHKKIIENISKVQQAYPISNTSIKFVKYLLENYQEVESYANDTIKERNLVCKILLETGKYDVLNSHTNFIHINEKSKGESKIVPVLEKHGIACKFNTKIPGDERANWVRLSIGPGMHNLPFFKELL